MRLDTQGNVESKLKAPFVSIAEALFFSAMGLWVLVAVRLLGS